MQQPPKETQKTTFMLPFREFMRAVFVDCVAMELKTNMQNSVAPFEKAIRVSEEQRR